MSVACGVLVYARVCRGEGRAERQQESDTCSLRRGPEGEHVSHPHAGRGGGAGVEGGGWLLAPAAVLTCQALMLAHAQADDARVHTARLRCQTLQGCTSASAQVRCVGGCASAHGRFRPAPAAAARAAMCRPHTAGRPHGMTHQQHHAGMVANVHCPPFPAPSCLLHPLVCGRRAAIAAGGRQPLQLLLRLRRQERRQRGPEPSWEGAGAVRDGWPGMGVRASHTAKLHPGWHLQAHARTPHPLPSAGSPRTAPAPGHSLVAVARAQQLCIHSGVAEGACRRSE